jgi:hypothetical protein
MQKVVCEGVEDIDSDKEYSEGISIKSNITSNNDRKNIIGFTATG